MEAGRKTGGSKTGSKNRKAQERKRRAVGAGAAIVASTPTIAKTGDEDERAGIEVAGPGITPKDLLLIAMRNAWDDAHRKADEAEELERQATVLDQEAAAESLELEALLGGLQCRRTTKLDATVQLRARASTLRLEVGLDIRLATALAKDVAPYVHPKLISHYGEINQTVTVISQQL